MNRETVTAHSKNLGKDMSIRVYGESGWPIVAFPIQDAMSDCYEQFGMVDAMKDYIEGGKVQLFVLDSVDAEGWSDRGGDNVLRVKVIEAFYNYVCEEVVPFVHERNGSDLRPLTMGCSLGATHALVAFLRRPDLFQGVIALSGGYDAQFFFGDWMNTTLYFNSPVHFLPNTPHDHPYIDLYNRREIVLCCGQGAWEEEGLRTEHIVDDAFRALGVDAWCDYWGNDVDHDWPWWQKQIQYFLPYVLDEAKKYHAEEVAEAAKNAPAKPVTAKKPAGTKATRTSRAKARARDQGGARDQGSARHEEGARREGSARHEEGCGPQGSARKGGGQEGRAQGREDRTRKEGCTQGRPGSKVSSRKEGREARCSEHRDQDQGACKGHGREARREGRARHEGRARKEARRQEDHALSQVGPLAAQTPPATQDEAGEVPASPFSCPPHAPTPLRPPFLYRYL